MGLMIIFLLWGALCVGAVLRGRMLLWAALCLLPLGALSFLWWWDHAGRSEPMEDPFGLQLATTLAFVAMSLITAATGALSLVVTASSAAAAGAPRDQGGGSPQPRHTLWQRLWWRPGSKAD
jgi:hypothetical protein